MTTILLFIAKNPDFHLLYLFGVHCQDGKFKLFEGYLGTVFGKTRIDFQRARSFKIDQLSFDYVIGIVDFNLYDFVFIPEKNQQTRQAIA